MGRKHPDRDRTSRPAKKRGRSRKPVESENRQFGQLHPELTAQREAEYWERQRKICEAKDRYATREEARAFALMHQPGVGPRASVYNCKVCGGWHHTRSAV